jgi:hypothetical protein
MEKSDRTMTRKNNWACNACGMSSGRRYSMQRHIDNQNIHGGKGRIVPYSEYLAGVNSGLYNPSIDSLVNTQKRISSEHETLSQKAIGRKAEAAASNVNESQKGEGTKIYCRQIIKRIADDDADEMIKSWKGQPNALRRAETAHYFRQYEMALAGKADHASVLEKLVDASADKGRGSSKRIFRVDSFGHQQKSSKQHRASSSTRESGGGV